MAKKNMDFEKLKDHIHEFATPGPEEEPGADDQEEKRWNDSMPKEIISIFAYLIGVRKEIFENVNEPPSMDTYQKLEKNRNAAIIRNLCMIRTDIEKNFKKIMTETQINKLQIWLIADKGYINKEALEFLLHNGIDLSISKIKRADEYIQKINLLIKQRISNCKNLFPSYLNWDYIKELFIMPGGDTPQGCEEAARTYYENYKFYPYTVYMNWQPRSVGNLLFNDRRFVTTIYEMHGDEFTETGRISGLSEFTKKSIESFFKESRKLDMIVDCENSDPYKLAAALRNLDDDLKKRIHKLILVDDPNTAPVWDNFNLFVKGIPIKYINNERLLSEKSLVDVRLASQVMYEYCREEVDSFVLVSSDSDFWGVISGMYDNKEDGIDAKFLLFVQRQQTSRVLTEVLRDHNIYYAYLDNFYSGNCEDIKHIALMMEIKKYVRERFKLNINDIYDEAIQRTFINFTDPERQSFYEKYIKTVKLDIDQGGNMELVFKNIA